MRNEKNSLGFEIVLLIFRRKGSVIVGVKQGNQIFGRDASESGESHRSGRGGGS